MKYVGSKRDVRRFLLPIVLADRKPGQWYVEPFVGGANIFQEVENPRLGYDANPYTIAVLAAVRDGWVPPSVVTEEDYKHIQANKDDYPPELVGFVGFGCSFGAKFFGGYGRRNDGHTCAQGSHKSLLKTAPKLQGAGLFCHDYRDAFIPPDSIIYCDPPYQGTLKYYKYIDHEQFWQWCRDRHSDGHQVFVSEIDAPDDFRCVFERPSSRRGNTCVAGPPRMERLFVP